MRIKGLKTFHVNFGMFDYGVQVVICSDEKKVEKYVKWYQETDEIVGDTENSRGACFSREGYCPIIWIRRKPRLPEEFGTLTHESFHAVCKLADWAGIELTSDTEEVFAHATSYLVRKVLER